MGQPNNTKQDAEELKLKIINACSQITAPLCRKVRYSVEKRLGKCIEVEGGYFEPLVITFWRNKLLDT